MNPYKSNTELKIYVFTPIFINMKEPFQFFINNVLKDDVELLFGEGSEIVVNFIRYSTNNKSFTVDCKLLTTNPELCKETFPDGISHLSYESWKYMGIKENIHITSTIDLK